MRQLKLLLVILCVLPALALAADKARPTDLQPLEEVQPPPNTLDSADDSTLEPQITIRKKGKETVEEYRINGELYMMKITPEHGVPYYMHKADQNGGWLNDGPNPPLSVPKWVIFRF
jgi:Protein of unknown function (DUF2782)